MRRQTRKDSLICWQEIQMLKHPALAKPRALLIRLLLAVCLVACLVWLVLCLLLLPIVMFFRKWQLKVSA
jgi:hypothetical protein